VGTTGHVSADAIRAQAVAGLGKMPPFSPVLNRLLATVASDDVSFAEAAALIENDTVLAGTVLRLVNSPLYGFQGTVNSVRHAVAILGVGKLRNVALSLSISRMWTHVRMPPEWSASKFNLHSVSAAVFSDQIAQRKKVPYPEGAFVAGLLHDIGKMLLAIACPEEYSATRSLRAKTLRTEIDCELELTGVTHAELSGLALSRWNLPLPITRAAACHHTPEEADEGRLHLSYVVCAADRLANELGHSTSEHRDQPGQAESAFDALQLGDCAPKILDEFQLEFEVMKAFF
jgi:HD-like signal output (HDOD) protein